MLIKFLIISELLFISHYFILDLKYTLDSDGRIINFICLES